MDIIDFAPAMHGHFLEYVINAYIYNAPQVNSIFNDAGTMDEILLNTEYMQSRQIMCGHYSSESVAIPNVDRSIFIKCSNTTDFDFILLSNILFRAGTPDSGCVNDRISQLTIDFKNDWYDKLQNRSFMSVIGYRLNDYTIPTLYVEYESFFRLDMFITMLANIAVFLNSDFKPDSSLIKLYDTFMLNNQGYQLYRKSLILLDDVLRNKKTKIDDNQMIQAYLNLRLTQMFDIWSGELFTPHYYPANTREVNKIIERHLLNQN